MVTRLLHDEKVDTIFPVIKPVYNDKQQLRVQFKIIIDGCLSNKVVLKKN